MAACEKAFFAKKCRPIGKAGVGLHLTSLPGPYGIGEIGKEAFAFVDNMRKMHLGVWQFLPLGPTAFGDSPYQPLSTFAGNEMLIDIADLLKKRLLKRREVAALTRLPGTHVDYSMLTSIKCALLESGRGSFCEQSEQATEVRFR